MIVLLKNSCIYVHTDIICRHWLDECLLSKCWQVDTIACCSVWYVKLSNAVEVLFWAFAKNFKIILLVHSSIHPSAVVGGRLTCNNFIFGRSLCYHHLNTLIQFSFTISKVINIFKVSQNSTKTFHTHIKNASFSHFTCFIIVVCNFMV